MDQNTTGPRLTPAEYWEWRTTIAEMQIAQLNFRVASLEVKLLAKDAEVIAARIKLHSVSAVGGTQKRLDEAKAEYARIKTALEGRLGVSLNQKVIDEVTYEVKDLPVEEAPKQPLNH